MQVRNVLEKSMRQILGQRVNVKVRAWVVWCLSVCGDTVSAFRWLLACLMVIVGGLGQGGAGRHSMIRIQSDFVV